MATTEPQPTLRELLRRRDLRLRLALTEDELEPEALDRTIRWVHGSDLADPTPFLADDLILLTTGTQFVSGDAGAAEDPAPYDEYVARLDARGVRGLGFGTEVVRAGIPPALVEACRAVRMPLFEVPYRTPFIAVARANAEAIAAQAYARRGWALSAQRALSLAALRAGGVESTLVELGRQLETWAGLFDATGTVTREHAGPLAPETAAALREEVAGMLRRGARAGAAVRIGGADFTVQTLGRGGHLRGAVALAVGGLDHEARGVVTAAVATIGLALEQQESVERARRALHRGIAQLLLSGQSALAGRTLRETGMSLPAEPVLVAVAGLPTPPRAAWEWVDAHAAEARGALFAGGMEDGILLIVPASARGLLDEFAAQVDARVGVSAHTRYAGLAEAVATARVARERGTAPVTHFGELIDRGILPALTGAGPRAAAAALIAPLRAHDERTGSDLTGTVRGWLDAECSHERAARELGVHRHTVRARLAQAETLLGRDLSSFAVRAELWTAFALDAAPPRADQPRGA
ncbi:PucR family transcriptional regulator [uncultured Microbacterium sp.]|uniref:Regulator of polyketide synthase expression n=1 Tax=uncultured Microbacterium sp. TaxID=191216 RepID=A0A1Y5NXY4_9MICO|nr:PucR family transcriptional regulator [uncultured Microbacterium sp.]SBS71367.1 Regulator of polyketide synthase expression [uncultured Microbacterium sp.]